MGNETKKKSKLGLILIILILIIVAGGAAWYFTVGKDMFKNEENDTSVAKSEEKEVEKTQGEEKKEVSSASKYVIKDSNLSNFDLEFLKLENEKKNKIYSPLSIKYTLGMLNEGTAGNSKAQIAKIIGEYNPRKYTNSKNMSFANAFFIRDTYKNDINKDFSNTLKNKFNAEVVYDSFSSASSVNKWISDKTLKLVNDALTDSDVTDLNFALVNALAIDMDWDDKFLAHIDTYGYYDHEKFGWVAPQSLVKGSFKDVKNDISGMQIMTAVNNYDIVKTIGEENIRKTVGDAFRKHLENHPDSYYFDVQPDIDIAVKDYLDEYINTLNGYYKDVTKNTDYSFYVDNDVKAFGKELKKYDGVTLEYVAVMPKKEELTSYIDDLSVSDINDIIKNLKDLKSENMKDGVITVINGYIPKFKFDYELDLINDLKKMGVEDVFNSSKADLSGITEKEAYIGTAVHKANVEFTQDGIKAAAATMAGGMGAGEEFNYYYDVPVEEIDLIFDKPYMFIIRDKDTGEVWFAGTVYNPLDLKDEKEKNIEEMSEFYINDWDTLVDE